ncbi:MAG TPA: N,N-dimethylformamidase beta subunit family domain-containing protein [Candidatus Binataceae bacterium]|nr:N,N-dimethylformamidase beta subunit family domain-containing protein [Candidatus Binataceae bacterium]
MAETSIHGYSDRISVAPGERIRFMVSVEGAARYRADIVRLIHGDANPAGPGFKEEVVETAVSGDHPGRTQPIRAGSHVLIDDPGGLLNVGNSITVHTFIMPTTPAKGVQGVVTRCDPERRMGWALLIDGQGRLALWLGDGAGRLVQVAATTPLMAGIWYSAGASYDGATGRAIVHLAPVVNSYNSRVGPVAALAAPVVREVDVERVDFHSQSAAVIAGWAEGTSTAGATLVGGHYNGKIDRPRVYGHALSADELAGLAAGREPDSRGLIARWDFADGIGPIGIPSDRVTDASGNDLHGRCVNAPARAVTGHNFSGREEHFIHAPAEYGAIHFHDDDLEDAGWEPSFELIVPDTMRSDVYAARVRAGNAVDYIPFFVRPASGRPTAQVLFLAPTASYMAYANEHLGVDVGVGDAIMGHTTVLQQEDLYLCAHPELGLSTYDHHSDGSGVCYSSRLRPIPNMRPNYRHETGSLWGFAADLDLIGWLNARGIRYDVATDEDLHREGAALLRNYRVALTGTHPEYYSSAMLDAMEAFLGSGGRLMYLGGNGFYWVTSFHPDKPHLIEVRKAEGGSRAWQAQPGEYFHSTTGERGGVWRNRGRAPQKLVGVGFAAQGFDRSSYFRRMPDSRDPRASFIFAGVGEDELIGDFGLVGGGAAGHELDRYDLSLGTPPNAMLVACSEGHSDSYQRVVEEIYFMYPGAGGTQDPGVRGDIVYYTTAGGGAVFSASSIAWCGSLSHNNYDNNVSRITANVLERFLSAEPLPATS